MIMYVFLVCFVLMDKTRVLFEWKKTLKKKIQKNDLRKKSYLLLRYPYDDYFTVKFIEIILQMQVESFFSEPVKRKRNDDDFYNAEFKKNRNEIRTYTSILSLCHCNIFLQVVDVLTSLGVQASAIRQFIMYYRDISSLQVLYDSLEHEQTAAECHRRIDGKGKTITFAINGNVCNLNLWYYHWVYV